MNIFFISLDDFSSIQERGTYSDVLREFIRQGHYVCAISPTASVDNSGNIHESELCDIIKPLIVNSQKTGFVKKGISIAILPIKIKRCIVSSGILCKKQFDLILYATPPVTIAPIIEYLKKKNRNAKSFLLLKDMWPQVAIDVGMLQDTGIRGILAQVLRKYEKRIYNVSDIIGCMSPANVDYVVKHHSIQKEKVILSPNSMEPFTPIDNNSSMRQKLGIENNKVVFLYGGNIGKMQGIPFLCECLKVADDYDNLRIIVCGNGTEYGKLNAYIKEHEIKNTILINGLPREDFESLTSECDYGLVFLDYRATTPNFPSRILPYMNNSKPIIACTDRVTDIGSIIEENHFGWWVPSNDTIRFRSVIERAISNQEYNDMCERSYQFLLNHYTAEKTVEIITKAIS